MMGSEFAKVVNRIEWVLVIMALSLGMVIGLIIGRNQVASHTVTMNAGERWEVWAEGPGSITISDTSPQRTVTIVGENVSRHRRD